VSGSFPGCCSWGTMLKSLTTTVSPGQVYSGYAALTIGPSEICCPPGLTWSVPSCVTPYVVGAPCDELHRPSSLGFTAELRRNSNSVPVITWAIKDESGSGKGKAPEEGHYLLSADGMSQAIATVINTSESPTFVFAGDSLGCIL